MASRPCPTATIALVDTAEAEVRMLVAERPSLGRELADAPGITQADVVQAIVNEGALRLEDVVDRRLRLGLRLDAVTFAAVRDVSDVMGRALGWTEPEAEGAARDYLSRAGRGLVN
jgi:glycerol-3-phosphate dehydrogenase